MSTKVHLIKAIVFPVVMYGCESWTIKKSECRRIDAFELWCWTESPLDCRKIQPVHSKGNQSWVFIERSDVEAETPYFGRLMQRTDSFEKTLMLGWMESVRRRGDRGWDGWMASLIQWRWVWVNSGSWWWTGRPGVLQSMRSQRVGHDWVTELNWKISFCKDGWMWPSIVPMIQKQNL